VEYRGPNWHVNDGLGHNVAGGGPDSRMPAAYVLTTRGFSTLLVRTPTGSALLFDSHR
jgi:hypothetical protein